MNFPQVQKWTYLEITVMDGERRLYPREICSFELSFEAPPAITSERVTVITRNGDRTVTKVVRVLPHDAGACDIPVEIDREVEIEIVVSGVKQERTTLVAAHPVS